jgi:hypothetical protein
MHLKSLRTPPLPLALGTSWFVVASHSPVLAQLAPGTGGTSCPNDPILGRLGAAVGTAVANVGGGDFQSPICSIFFLFTILIVGTLLVSAGFAITRGARQEDWSSVLPPMIGSFAVFAISFVLNRFIFGN